MYFRSTSSFSPVEMDATAERLFVFPSELGWMAIRAGKTAVRRLTFGHSSPGMAVRAVGNGLDPCHESSPWQHDVIELLQAYADGRPVDFSQVSINLDGMSGFRRLVLSACRDIPYGKTVTYGRLAAKVGADGAARAVGTCMAKNPLPLIIPCHRVIRAGGVIGPYSAAEGTETKRRLLAMEAAHSPAAFV
jgi:methylated-DNA-[protein]-cysteine S-methyltransferase